MGFLIVLLTALFIVVLSACVMGLALFVVAALSGSYGDKKKIEHEGPRPAPPTPAAVVAILKWAAAAFMPEEDWAKLIC